MASNIWLNVDFQGLRSERFEKIFCYAIEFIFVAIILTEFIGI